MGAEKIAEGKQLIFWLPCKDASEELKGRSYRQLVSWPSKTAVTLQSLHLNDNLSEKTPRKGTDIRCAEPGTIFGYCCCFGQFSAFLSYSGKKALPLLGREFIPLKELSWVSLNWILSLGSQSLDLEIHCHGTGHQKGKRKKVNQPI